MDIKTSRPPLNTCSLGRSEKDNIIRSLKLTSEVFSKTMRAKVATTVDDDTRGDTFMSLVIEWLISYFVFEYSCSSHPLTGSPNTGIGTGQG